MEFTRTNQLTCIEELTHKFQFVQTKCYLLDKIINLLINELFVRKTIFYKEKKIPRVIIIILSPKKYYDSNV